MELKTKEIIKFLETLDKDKVINLNSEFSCPEILCANSLTKKEHEMATFSLFEPRTRDGLKSKYTRVEESYAEYCRNNGCKEKRKKKVSEILKDVKKLVDKTGK